MKARALRVAAAPVLGTLLALCAACAAVHGGELGLRLENDDLPLGSNHDQYYTQATQLDYALPASPERPWIEGTARALDRLSPARLFASRSRRERVELGLVLGQHVYTPRDIATPTPDPADRPYSGWLYAGLRASILQLGDDARRDDAQSDVELSLGITGSPSLAEAVQTGWHGLFGLPKPQGWDQQLDAEPTLQLAGTYQRRMLHQPGPSRLAGDLALRGGYQLGNFMTSLGAGSTLRLGFELPRAFASSGIEPALSRTLGRDGEAYAWSAYGFVDLEGRAVLHDLSLDGNTFTSSPEVERELFVADLSFGLVARVRRWELGYAVTWRTPQFEGQDGPEQFASLFLRFGFAF